VDRQEDNFNSGQGAHINGKVFEHDSKPQRIGGKTVGKGLRFRDVTERKQIGPLKVSGESS